MTREQHEASIRALIKRHLAAGEIVTREALDAIQADLDDYVRRLRAMPVITFEPACDEVDMRGGKLALVALLNSPTKEPSQ